MNQAIQTEDFNKAIEAECKKYFFHTKRKYFIKHLELMRNMIMKLIFS